MSLSRTVFWGNLASAVSIPHIVSVRSMLDKLSWKHCDSLSLTKGLLPIALQPLRHQNNVHLLSFPLLLRIETPARKFAFSINEVKKTPRQP